LLSRHKARIIKHFSLRVRHARKSKINSGFPVEKEINSISICWEMLRVMPERVIKMAMFSDSKLLADDQGDIRHKR
jgi:hypothetical protein